jgi:hypothetical protein
MNSGAGHIELNEQLTSERRAPGASKWGEADRPGVPTAPIASIFLPLALLLHCCFLTLCSTGFHRPNVVSHSFS